MTDTVKNYLFDEAPGTIVLEGDKEKAIEPVTHIIEFPGGSIEVSRIPMADGTFEYWAHIAVNKKQLIPGSRGRDGKMGRIVRSRLDYQVHPDVPIKPTPIAMDDLLEHIAVRITASEE